MLNNAPTPGSRPDQLRSAASTTSMNPHVSGLEGVRAPTLKLDEEERQRIVGLALHQEEQGSPLHAALRADFVGRFESAYRRVGLVSLASVGSVVAGIACMIGTSSTVGGLLASVAFTVIGLSGILLNSVQLKALDSKAKNEFKSSFSDGPLLVGYHYLHVEGDHSRAAECFRDALNQQDAPATQVRAVFGLISVMAKAKRVESFDAAFGQIADHVLGLPVPMRLIAPRAQYGLVETIRVVAERMMSTRHDYNEPGLVEHPYINERNVRQLLSLLRSAGPFRPVAIGMLAELPDELLRRFSGRGPQIREALSELKGAVDVYLAPEQKTPQTTTPSA
jgi:hypothetical protein